MSYLIQNRFTYSTVSSASKSVLEFKENQSTLNNVNTAVLELIFAISKGETVLKVCGV